MHKKFYYLTFILLLSAQTNYSFFLQQTFKRLNLCLTNSKIGASLVRSLCKQSKPEFELTPNILGEKKRLIRLQEALCEKRYVKSIKQRNPDTIEIKVTPVPQVKVPKKSSKHPAYNPTGC